MFIHDKFIIYLCSVCNKGIYFLLFDWINIFFYHVVCDLPVCFVHLFILIFSVFIVWKQLFELQFCPWGFK